MATIREVIKELEQIAPPVYQEGYDNAGLIVGDASAEVSGVLTCLDSTEAVVEEAIARGCNLVVAHHPIVFKGLKRLTGRNYVERTVLKAIKNDVAIYAIHTNLDNVLHRGVNQRIGQRLGLEQPRILAPKSVLRKLTTYVPLTQCEQLRAAFLDQGAEAVAVLEQASLNTRRNGWSNEDNLNGRTVRMEVQYGQGVERQILNTLREKHPHESAFYEIAGIDAQLPQVGSGLIGVLPESMAEEAFLQMLKERMQVSCIRYTALRQKDIRTVALCGGAGGFLLQQAIGAGADIFITADYKYHEFFDADGQIIIADIGHFESEQFTIPLLKEILSEKFTTFATYSTEVRTNPIQYWC